MGSQGFIVSVTAELPFVPLVVRVYMQGAPSKSMLYSGNVASSLEALMLVPLLNIASE